MTTNILVVLAMIGALVASRLVFSGGGWSADRIIMLRGDCEVAAETKQGKDACLCIADAISEHWTPAEFQALDPADVDAGQFMQQVTTRCEGGKP